MARRDYALVKRYNPSYGFFIFRFFGKNGIEIDEKITLRDAEAIALAFQNREQEARGKETTKFLVWGGWGDDLAPPEKLFWDFVHYWSSGPWHRPTNLLFFQRIFAGNRLPSYEKLKEMEAELPSDDKLLFTTDEVAADIVAFYTKHVIDPLREELAGERSRRRLLRYLSFDEMRRIPDVRQVGTEKHDEVIGRMALEVQNWLGAITEDEVAREIDRVLEEHWKDAGSDHMRLDTETKYLHCHHLSDYVEIYGSRLAEGAEVQDVRVQPARGFRIWVRHEGESDYSDVIFPQFTVVRL